MTARSVVDGQKVKYDGGVWVPENGDPGLATFPNGVRFRSYLGGPEVELHCSANYTGIATFRHPDGRQEDFFWLNGKYDGHGMEPAENEGGDGQQPTTNTCSEADGK